LRVPKHTTGNATEGAAIKIARLPNTLFALNGWTYPADMPGMVARSSAVIVVQRPTGRHSDGTYKIDAKANMQPNPRQPAPLTIPPRTLIAYRATRYEAGDIDIRIGRRSPAMDALLAAHRARQAALITAYNPFSRRMPLRWNQRMHARLLQELARHYKALPATGTLRRWSEAHLLVLGDIRPIRKLARRFRQNSIVILRRGQPARLHFLVA
jgi:hypothetical protein